MKKKFIQKFLTACFTFNFLLITFFAPLSTPLSPRTAFAADNSCGGATNSGGQTANNGINEIIVKRVNSFFLCMWPIRSNCCN